MTLMLTPLERFERHVVRTPDCWLWPKRMPNGRARAIYVNGKYTYPYRLAHELFVGPIPDGYDVDHLCRNTACVRPDHLEAVTPAENKRRNLAAIKPKLDEVRKPRSMTCDRGHARKVQPNGGLHCPTCDALRSKAYRERKKKVPT